MLLSTLMKNSEAGGTGGGYDFVMPFTDSNVYNVSFDAVIEIIAIGAGGGGYIATGYPDVNFFAINAHSAAWGVKKISVKAGDVLVITVGAVVNGEAVNKIKWSGSTSVSLNGVVILEAQGGLCARVGTSNFGSMAVEEEHQGKIIGADYGSPSNILPIQGYTGRRAGAPLKFGFSSEEGFINGMLARTFAESLGFGYEFENRNVNVFSTGSGADAFRIGAGGGCYLGATSQIITRAGQGGVALKIKKV